MHHLILLNTEPCLKWTYRWHFFKAPSGKHIKTFSSWPLEVVQDPAWKSKGKSNCLFIWQPTILLALIISWLISNRLTWVLGSILPLWLIMCFILSNEIQNSAVKLDGLLRWSYQGIMHFQSVKIIDKRMRFKTFVLNYLVDKLRINS